jgi:hypothetical protein
MLEHGAMAIEDAGHEGALEVEQGPVFVGLCFGDLQPYGVGTLGAITGSGSWFAGLIDV